jgi:hypothetical protein
MEIEMADLGLSRINPARKKKKKNPHTSPIVGQSLMVYQEGVLGFYGW